MQTKFTRPLSLILALVMMLTLIPGAAAYSNVSGWAEDKLAAMDQEGLIPESLQDADMKKPISRLDMCRAAVLAYEKVQGSEMPLPQEHPFTDTTDPAVEKAYLAGLVSGDGDGTYRPDDALTRLEFFCIIATFVEKLDYPITEADYDDLTRFADAYQLPDWGRKRTQLAVGLGIVAGSGNELNWRASATREEGLALFYKAYQVATGAEQTPDDTEPTEPESTEPEYQGDFINLASWAEKPVRAMDELGLIPNEVKATPMDGNLSRQNLCKVIMLAYKQLTGVSDGDLGTPENPFTDTDDLDVRNAYRLGIVSGKGDGKFCPDDPVSRQDFFVMSINFLNAIGYPYTDDDTADLSQFVDADEVASYALPATRLIVSIKAVSGNSDGELNPRDYVVCQEALAIFYKIHTFVTTWVAPEEQPDERPEEDQELAQQVVDFALQFLGYPYVYAGRHPDEGFDCSGFVYYVYKQFGYTLNPGATTQWNALSDVVIPRESLQPGDLVFFSGNGDVSGMEHVGLYIGNGQMIHASTPSTGVIITDLSEPYYVRKFLGGKRVIE